MAYFLSHPNACRLYAKCHGWQETLAHFFVKARRASSAQLLSPLVTSSMAGLSSCSKEQSLASSQNSSNRHQLSISITDIAGADDASEDGLIEKPDLLPVENVTVDSDLGSPSTSNNAPLNEIITTPPQSTSGSREDLLILLKHEDSSDNLNGMIGSNSDLTSTLQPLATSPSMITGLSEREKN